MEDTGILELELELVHLNHRGQVLADLHLTTFVAVVCFDKIKVRGRLVTLTTSVKVYP